MLRLLLFALVRKMAHVLLLLVGVAILSLSLAKSAGAQGVGRLLDFQPGARENAMGMAGVALLGEPSDALWWNPATLGFARMPSVQLTRFEFVPLLTETGRLYHHAAAAVPLKRFGGIGVSYTYLSREETEMVDESGTYLGKFVPHELSPAAAIGIRVLPDLSVGATARYVRIQSAPSSQAGTASTVGFDFGALCRASLRPATLSLGLGFENLGPAVKYINEDQSSPLSRNFRVGGAVTVPFEFESGFETGASAVLDYNQSLVTSEFHTVGGGGEVYVGVANILRASARIGYYSDPLGDIHARTWGWGARIVGLTLDWAWIPAEAGPEPDYLMKFTGGFHLEDLMALLGSRKPS